MDGDSNPEKSADSTFAAINAPSPPQHPHMNRARDRLRQFVHPSGRDIHIAESPQEAINLRRQLEKFHKNEEFDIYISGTPEHLDALRQARAHHEGRRDELRTQHQELYERFSDLHTELDSLSTELDRVTTHGVSLEAHFNKFGYDAHIKTYDDESASPSGSGTTTPTRSSTSEKSSELKCEKGYAKPLKLFKVPIVRQYFHKGTLWRAAGSEEVQSFELFVDLLYVGIIAINGDAASEDPTGKSLLQFVITFTLSWKIWNDMALIISWFETDDIFQRVSILTLLAMLFGYTTNIIQAFETTYATLIGFYLAARLFMAAYLVLVGILVPMVRTVTIYQACICLIGVALWVGSIHVSYPNQLALIWVAIFIDLCGPNFYFTAINFSERISPKTAAWLSDIFAFVPAINIEHRTERMNAFVTLVFGYSVVALLYQSTRNGIDAHYGKAVLGLAQAYCFNWMYFEVDGSNLYVHAIRRHKISAFAWTMLHLPFIMSFVLGAGALSRLVLAVDLPDSHLEGLTSTYRDRAEEEIAPGIRWFYCAGYGISMMCMGLISVSHVHREVDGLRLKKRWRLCGRFAVAVILICLPTAENLNSLQLVGTATGLIAFSLMLELWACSRCGEKLCQRSQPCKYFGHCGKRDLEALVKDGKEVDVEQLGSRGRKNSGLALGL